MRKELLNIIICKDCHRPSLQLDIDTEDHLEVVSGRLTCRRCKNTIKIDSGIPDFIYEPSNIIKNEISGNRKLYEEERKFFGKEWLLSLPGGFKPKGERIEINVRDSLKRLNLTGKERFWRSEQGLLGYLVGL